jgi:hypothetical protein
MLRINVVLPQPLGPSRPVTDDRGTVTDIESMTVWPPRITTRSRTSIAGVKFIMR